MQERLHIDELKRVEKMVNTLLKSWQKLSKNHAQLEEKHAKLTEELTNAKAKHQQEMTDFEQRYQDAEEAAKLALAEAVAEENQRWQQKYDETCATHESKVLELHEAHRLSMENLQEEMARNEQALQEELAQVKRVKEALSNRVLGVTE